MRPFPLAVLLVALALLTSPINAAPDNSDPTNVVQALYHNSMTHFGFDPDIVKSAKPWLTPGLYARLWKKANAPTPKGDAPDIEGDVFMDAQDAPYSFKVDDSSIHDTKATVGVTLVYSSEKRHYTVLLDKIGGAWKVSDVDYGQDGKLSDLLK
jgi:hypothetical protein